VLVLAVLVLVLVHSYSSSSSSFVLGWGSRRVAEDEGMEEASDGSFTRVTRIARKNDDDEHEWERDTIRVTNANALQIRPICFP
jgi:uncharacterized protein HemY